MTIRRISLVLWTGFCPSMAQQELDDDEAGSQRGHHNVLIVLGKFLQLVSVD